MQQNSRYIVQTCQKFYQLRINGLIFQLTMKCAHIYLVAITLTSILTGNQMVF